MRSFWAALLSLALTLHLFAGAAAAQGILENPPDNSYQSGIVAITGWFCSAGKIEIQFDTAPPLEAAYGTSRYDTLSVCGDTNNGFAFLWNWGIMTPGLHTVIALADGVEFARATITVLSLGGEFLGGLSGGVILDNFNGLTLTLQWQQSSQTFVVTQALPAVSDPGGAGMPTCAQPPPFVLSVRDRLNRFWAAVLPTPGVICEIDASDPDASSYLGNATVHSYLPDFVFYDAALVYAHALARGPFAAIAIAAHEYGHRIQLRLGQQFSSSVHRELSADCYAGIFARHLAVWDPTFSTEDLEDQFDEFCAIGDSLAIRWFSPIAHGTCLERQISFVIGYIAWRNAQMGDPVDPVLICSLL